MNWSSLAARLSRSPFMRFGMIGAGGFVVDEFVLALLHNGLGLDPYSAGALSFFCAANFTWWGNRNFTFAEHRAHGMIGIAREWYRFMLANGVGALVNLGLYMTLVKFAPPPLNIPFLAKPFGVLAGLAFNFTLSKRMVFRPTEANSE